MKNLEEREQKRNALALFKYALIAPVVNDTFTESSKSEYFRNAAQKEYTLNNHKVKFASSTIKGWYLSYLKDNYNGLLPKTRCDISTSRKLSDEAIGKIYEYKEKYPHITGTLIYQKLDEEGFINSETVSLGTVLKYIRDNKENFESDNIDRRAFVMPHVNDCWQADTSQGPYLKIGKDKIKTYLIAIIDDKSRLIVGAKFFFNDNALNFQEVLKSSIKKYGVPKKLFVDNGKTYKNEQLGLICANLGMVLIHARPYSGASKGKVERFFHTMKATWMRGLDWDEIKSIDELNDMLALFINDYNHKEHSSLTDGDKKYSPHSKFFSEEDLIKKVDNDFVDVTFLHTEIKKIRSDAIAKIKEHEFEVDSKYIGCQIIIKYDPFNFEDAWICKNNELIDKIHLVDKEANSKIKRKSTLY